MIDPGTLSERVTLRKNAPGIDLHGGDDGTGWSDLATVWARVRQVSGNARYIADAMHAGGDWQVTIHRRSDVEIGQRVAWGGITMEITGINNMHPQPYLMLYCRKD